MWYIQVGVVVGAIALFILFGYFMNKSIKAYEDNKTKKRKKYFKP